MDIKIIFSERVKGLIKENNSSIYQIAKELQINEKSLGNWTNGRNEPSISTLKKLADYFNVCADYLIGRQDWY